MWLAYAGFELTIDPAPESYEHPPHLWKRDHARTNPSTPTIHQCGSTSCVDPSPPSPLGTDPEPWFRRGGLCIIAAKSPGLILSGSWDNRGRDDGL